MSALFLAWFFLAVGLALLVVAGAYQDFAAELGFGERTPEADRSRRPSLKRSAPSERRRGGVFVRTAHFFKRCFNHG